MKNLKNNWFSLVLALFFLGCQTKPVFQLESFNDPDEDLHVVQTNSDRVQQKCLFLNAEGDNNWRHQYFMYILNDKNEVLEIMEATHMDSESCRRQLGDIEKVLKESQVKVCIRGKLNKSLTFDSICNSKKCVGENNAWVKTCPGFPKQ